MANAAPGQESQESQGRASWLERLSSSCIHQGLSLGVGSSEEFSVCCLPVNHSALKPPMTHMSLCWTGSGRKQKWDIDVLLPRMTADVSLCLWRCGIVM